MFFLTTWLFLSALKCYVLWWEIKIAGCHSPHLQLSCWEALGMQLHFSMQSSDFSLPPNTPPSVLSWPAMRRAEVCMHVFLESCRAPTLTCNISFGGMIARVAGNSHRFKAAQKKKRASLLFFFFMVFMFCCVWSVGRYFCGSQRREGEEGVTGEMGGKDRGCVVMQVFRQRAGGSRASGQVRCVRLYMANISIYTWCSSVEKLFFAF